MWAVNVGSVYSLVPLGAVTASFLDHLILYRNPATLHLPGEHVNKALEYTAQYSLRRFMVVDVDKSSRVRGLLNGNTA